MQISLHSRFRPTKKVKIKIFSFLGCIDLRHSTITWLFHARGSSSLRYYMKIGISYVQHYLTAVLIENWYQSFLFLPKFFLHYSRYDLLSNKRAAPEKCPYLALFFGLLRVEVYYIFNSVARSSKKAPKYIIPLLLLSRPPCISCHGKW